MIRGSEFFKCLIERETARRALKKERTSSMPYPAYGSSPAEDRYVHIDDRGDKDRGGSERQVTHYRSDGRYL